MQSYRLTSSMFKREKSRRSGTFSMTISTLRLTGGTTAKAQMDLKHNCVPAITGGTENIITEPSRNSSVQTNSQSNKHTTTTTNKNKQTSKWNMPLILLVSCCSFFLVWHCYIYEKHKHAHVKFESLNSVGIWAKLYMGLTDIYI